MMTKWQIWYMEIITVVNERLAQRSYENDAKGMKYLTNINKKRNNIKLQ